MKLFLIGVADMRPRQIDAVRLLAKEHNIAALTLLAETHAHPGYIGAKSAREIIKVLNKHLNLKLNLINLDKDVRIIEREMKKQPEFHHEDHNDLSEEVTNYIG